MGDRSGISRATLESASFKVAGRDEREALARAEDLLLEARRMELVGRLASAVAHDFNNALSVILTYCDLLATEPGSAQNVTADVLDIQKAATRAARLSQQLVNFSRRRTLAPRPIDLTETCSQSRASSGRRSAKASTSSSSSSALCRRSWRTG